MVANPPAGIGALLAIQLVGGALALLLLALTPAAQGTYALVALDRDAPVARLAAARGAVLLGHGRGGMLIVRGERAALFWPLLRTGVVTVAAHAALCGEVA